MFTIPIGQQRGLEVTLATLSPENDFTCPHCTVLDITVPVVVHNAQGHFYLCNDCFCTALNHGYDTQGRSIFNKVSVATVRHEQ